MTLEQIQLRFITYPVAALAIWLIIVAGTGAVANISVFGG